MLINKETNRSVFVRIVYDCVQKSMCSRYVFATISLYVGRRSVNNPLIL